MEAKDQGLHFTRRFEHRWNIYEEEWNREGLPDGRSGRKKATFCLSLQGIEWMRPRGGFPKTLQAMKTSPDSWPEGKGQN